MLGILGAAASAGQLVSVPALMWLVVEVGWRQGVVFLALATLAVLPLVLFFMRDDPERMGLRPYGEHGSEKETAATDSPAPEPGTPLADAPSERGGVMSRALRAPEFWLLSGSFFICGASSNGIIGVHFVPHSIDHGIPEVTAAGVLALMGAMNFVGTIASGLLTDRYDPRKLLAIYYSLRGLSLLLLPFVTDFAGLAVFAVFFGLDYIATVPPTVALVADRFGRLNVGTVFGWVFCAHQLGAASASYLGGVARDVLGDYTAAFLTAGILAILAALMASLVRRDAITNWGSAGVAGETGAVSPRGSRRMSVNSLQHRRNSRSPARPMGGGSSIWWGDDANDEDKQDGIQDSSAFRLLWRRPESAKGSSAHPCTARHGYRSGLR